MQGQTVNQGQISKQAHKMMTNINCMNKSAETTQEKMVCSLALIWCAKTAQGVLISKSSTANVLSAHSSVLVINYRITNSTSDSAHWCVE